jgi:hypothetical protein
VREKIKIRFADFYEGFDRNDNYFTDLLSERYELEQVDEPDILIYSAFGRSHVAFRCLKIFWTGENRRADFRECDFAFTFDKQTADGRNYRMPLYVHYPPFYGYGDISCLVNGRPCGPAAAAPGIKTKFCNMVISNPRRDRTAMEFFRRLSEYKKVDSGGRFLNNLGGPVPDKLAFIKDYKFTMAFENCSHPGYTTEKILDPLLVGSVPIYWGNPEIASEFNPDSFVNLHDFATLEDAVRRVIEIDRDDDLYRRMAEAPVFHGDRLPEYLTREAILKKFSEIIDNRRDIVPVACTWRYYPRYVAGKAKDAYVAMLKAARMR